MKNQQFRLVYSAELIENQLDKGRVSLPFVTFEWHQLEALEAGQDRGMPTTVNTKNG